jgi:hypothetical protein
MRNACEIKELMVQGLQLDAWARISEADGELKLPLIKCVVGVWRRPQQRQGSSPEILEPRRRQFRIAHRVLDVLVAEVSLQRPRVVALIGQRVTACVPEHVGVRLEPELRLSASAFDHPGKASGCERGSSFRGEEVGRLWLLLALEPSKGAEFVAEDRMRAGSAFLDSTNVQGGRFAVHLFPAKVDQFERS